MSKEKGGKKFYKKWWFWLIVAVVVIGMGSGSGGDSSTETDKNDSNKKTVTENKKEDKSKTRDNSSAKETTLSAGTFYVGEDITAGRYVCSGDSSGNFFLYDKSGMPQVNEILGGTEFGVTTVTTDLEEGQKIEIKSINNVLFKPAETKILSELSAGTWEVGLDIEEGRYVASVESGSGNFFVYRNKMPKVNEILEAAGELGVPNVTIELKKGDIIKISGLDKVTFATK